MNQVAKPHQEKAKRPLVREELRLVVDCAENGKDGLVRKIHVARVKLTTLGLTPGACGHEFSETLQVYSFYEWLRQSPLMCRYCLSELRDMEVKDA